MPPRLAREAVTAAALRGDSLTLLSANAYLPAREAFRYDRRRAAAFSAALAGERQLALVELGLGAGVRSVRLGVDEAVIELLTRGAAPAVAAVGLALRDNAHGEPDVPLVLAACVRRDPDVARRALAVAVSGGTIPERTRAAAAVLGAVRPGPVQAAVPALVAASVAVAVFAFLRLPGVEDPQEAATPRLQEPRPAVVVARPPRDVERESVRSGSARGVTPDASSIPVRFVPGSSVSSDETGSLSGREGSLPAPPRPAPGRPPPAPAGPKPTEPAPAEPTPPATPPEAAQPSTSARPAAPVETAAPPAPEPEREPAGVERSKAERKAEKAARKVEKAEEKAARKAENAAAPPPVSAQPTATPPVTTASAPENTSAVETTRSGDAEDERPSKPDKPEKPDKRK